MPTATTNAHLNDLFAALASEPRRQIVAHLTGGATTTPAIAERFDFSKQALNRHVVALEDAGLISRRLVGRVHEVELVPARLDMLKVWADQVREAWEGNLDRLGDVLGEMSDDKKEMS